MKVPLLDLRAQYVPLREEIRAVIDEVCDSQQFILGSKVEEFELAIAKYCGAATACGVTSGSDALLLCLMAEGIGPGDEVVTTPFTFFATAGAVARVGATPVFVDIDPATFNMDASKLEAALTSKTKAVIPVHLFGQMAAMEPVMSLARSRGLVVVEDAAQAIGSASIDGQAGSVGDYGCLSFFPSKNLGAFGDGGMVLAKDPARCERLKIFRNHGSSPKYYHKFIGGNFRIDALQAAILLVKLRHLDLWTEARQRNAAHYRSLFADSKAASKVVLPVEAPFTTRHIYNQFCVVFPDGQRDRVRDALTKADVGTEVYYPVPLHLQECFRYLGHKPGDMPHSEAACKNILALPIYPETTDAQRAHVVKTIEQVLN